MLFYQTENITSIVIYLRRDEDIYGLDLEWIESENEGWSLSDYDGNDLGDDVHKLTWTGEETVVELNCTTYFNAEILKAVFVIGEDEGPVVIDYGTCGTNVSWSLTNEGVLTITGTGAMTDYSAPFNMSPLSDNDLPVSVKSVSIGEGVTHVGNQALGYFPNLTSINIAASVTSLGGNAICSLENLTTVTFAEGSQLKTINRVNFNNCDALTSITLPASVTFIDEFVLDDCDNLTSVTLNSNPRIYNNHVFGSATVTMNLAVNKAAEGEYWTTFYNQNYNFEISDAVGQNTQIFKAALDGTKLTLTELETDKIITKNKAVILKSDASPMVFTLTTTDSGNNFDGNSLLGVSDASGLTANGTQYVLNKGSNGVGFYKMKSGKQIGVGKAYLTYTGGASSPEFFEFDDEVTRIAPIEHSPLTIDHYYDLSGRRVERPTRGIYIVNGKKVFIK